jgi:hypothetical protein
VVTVRRLLRYLCGSSIIVAADAPPATAGKTSDRRRCPVGIGIKLHHPAFDAVAVELWIDRAIKRAGELHTLAVVADLDHLRAAV